MNHQGTTVYRGANMKNQLEYLQIFTLGGYVAVQAKKDYN